MPISRNTLDWLHTGAATVHLTTAGLFYKLLSADDSERQKNPDAPGTRYDRDLAFLLPVFPLLSSLNHMVSVGSPTLYTAFLNNKTNPLRWIEYSVSAGVMLWLIARLIGIKDTRTLISLAMANAVLQYLGYLIEEARARNAEPKQIRQLLLAAWGVHLTIWVQLFIAFYSALNDAKIELPTLVYTILPIMFVLFSAFGLLETLWALGKIDDFEAVELGYLVLSVTSKVFLTFMVYFGVFRDPDIDTRQI